MILATFKFFFFSLLAAAALPRSRRSSPFYFSFLSLAQFSWFLRRGAFERRAASRSFREEFACEREKLEEDEAFSEIHFLISIKGNWKSACTNKRIPSPRSKHSLKICKWNRFLAFSASGFLPFFSNSDNRYRLRCVTVIRLFIFMFLPDSHQRAS